MVNMEEKAQPDPNTNNNILDWMADPLGLQRTQQKSNSSSFPSQILEEVQINIVPRHSFVAYRLKIREKQL